MSAAGQRVGSEGGGVGRGAPAPSRRRSAVVRRVGRLLDVAILLGVLAALALAIADGRAPRFAAAIPAGAVSSDGGHAFVFSPGFAPTWPYAVPSHPQDMLAQDDVAVLEDGRPIGALDPSHADIRERGGGLYNLWQGALWFSSSDDTDPRTNGREYRIVVKGRLAAFPAALLRWSFPILIALALMRVVIAIPPSLVGGIRRTIRRVSLSLVKVSHRVPHTFVRPVRAVATWIPLTFGRTYALASAAALLGFAWHSWQRPAPLFTQADSFGYIFPGLVWASGGDVTGQSLRDVGYPALTWIAVRLGSLSALPRIQLVLVVCGMACLLGVLYLTLAIAAERLKRIAAVPQFVSAVAAASASAIFVLLLASHDLFVIDIESAMAEAPHVLPTALAALLFIGGWIARSCRASLILLLSASLAAYISALFKPHTLIVIALCAASVVIKGLTHRRDLRSPLLLGYAVVVFLAAAGLHRADVQITPVGSDFGPRTLFCNRLDVILPVIDQSTPARKRIAAMMHDVMQDVGGWPLMGYSGDKCVYNADFQAALHAAADEEHVTPSRWMLKEFLHGVVQNPLRYVRDAAVQAFHFFEHPVVDIDLSATSDLARDDEARYAPYARLINMPRPMWKVAATNWVPDAYPRAASVAKHLLSDVAGTFPVVTLGGTLIAVIVLAAFGRCRDCRLEIVVVATALFTIAFIATILLSHSFDIGRYATDVLPISLLWWFVSAVYLVHIVILAAALPIRAGATRNAAEA